MCTHASAEISDDRFLVICRNFTFFGLFRCAHVHPLFEVCHDLLCSRLPLILLSSVVYLEFYVFAAPFGRLPPPSKVLPGASHPHRPSRYATVCTFLPDLICFCWLNHLHSFASDLEISFAECVYASSMQSD